MRVRILSSARKSRLLVIPLSLVLCFASLVVAGTAAAANTVTSAARFFVVTPINPTVGQTEAVKVSALDSANNVITNYAGTVTLTSDQSDDVVSSSNKPGSTHAYAYTASDHGTHTFYVTYKDSPGSITTLKARDAEATAASGTAEVTVGVAKATQLVATLDAGYQSSTTEEQSGVAFGITVTAENKYGVADQNASGSVTVTSSDKAKAGVTLPPACGLINGAFNFHTATAVTLATAGKTKLTFTDASAKLSGTFTVTVVPNVANHFVVSAPTKASTGQPLAVKVTAVDAQGNVLPASAYLGTVTLYSDSLHQDPISTPYTYQASDKSVHSFTTSLESTGTDDIYASDSSISGTSNGVVVTSGPAAQLALTPDTVQLGGGTEVTDGASTFTVTAENKYGGVVPSFGDAIAFTTSQGNDTSVAAYGTTAASMPYTPTFNSSWSGTHTFSLYLNTSSNGGPVNDTVTVADTSNAAVSSASTTVAVPNTGGEPTTLTVAAPSGGVTAGIPAVFTATALNTYGEPAYIDPGNTAAEKVAFTTHNTTANNAVVADTGASLTEALNTSTGVATDSITLNTTSADAVTATWTPTTGSPVIGTISPAATGGAVKSLVLVAPTGLNAPVAGVSSTYSVIAEDGNGVPVQTFADAVNVSTTNEGSNAPDPDSTTNILAGAGAWTHGVATTPITINTTQSDTITVTDATAGISGSLSETLGLGTGNTSATQLAVWGPSAPTAGVATNYTIIAENANGVPVPNFNGSVTVKTSNSALNNAIVPDSGSGLGAVTWASINQGFATVSLTLNTTAADTITATDLSFAAQNQSATKVANATGGSAVKLVLEAPATVTTAAAQNWTVIAEDVNSVPVAGFNGAVTISSTCINSTVCTAADVLPSTLTFNGGSAPASIQIKTLTSADADTVTASASGLASSSVLSSVGS